MNAAKRIEYSLVFLIAYSLLVFLWGAWVRISGSGDGCGEHWPFCYGVLLPESTEIKLIIENFHRISTKLYGFFVIGLAISIFRVFPKWHAARKFILWTFVFTLIEGLIGAIIVLKGLVTDDSSLERSMMISMHLLNTFFLMAAIGLSYVSVKKNLSNWNWRLGLDKTTTWIGFLILLIGSLGAIAALASTLFPSTSLIEGFAKDISSTSHFLLRIRALHPILGFCFLLWVWNAKLSRTHTRAEKYYVKVFKILLTVNVVIGTMTLGLLSPTVLKLIHLLVGHLLWLSFVFLVSERSLTVVQNPSQAS